MHCVHSGLVRHEVLEVAFDRIRDLHHVALNLALKPE